MSGVTDEKELSRALYEQIYLVRRAEEFIIQHYPENEMKTPMHMSMGQEAIPVGVCRALEPEDQIFTSYRGHAAFLAKTHKVEAFFAELYGRESGTAKGKSGSMHLADLESGHVCSSAVVASSIPVAVGMAFANQQRATDRISCVFFGDGAVEEGVFWESLNVACVMKVPVLFCCEDNGLAVHTTKRVRHGYSSITEVASTFDCNVFSGDATDVEAVYRLTRDAIRSIRETERPSFLHITCYRYLEHVGISEDFDAGYRSRAEYEHWYARDALALQRKRLAEMGESEAGIRALEEGITRRIEQAIELARADEFSPRSELFRGVFHEGD